MNARTEVIDNLYATMLTIASEIVGNYTPVVDLSGKEKGREKTAQSENPEMPIEVQKGKAESTHSVTSTQIKQYKHKRDSLGNSVMLTHCVI